MAETLELCVCGKCTSCPDGYHNEAEMPCGCTPDCAAYDPSLHEFQELSPGTCALCEQPKAAHE